MQGDLALAFTLDVMRTRRPDLRIMIMSATLHAPLIARLRTHLAQSLNLPEIPDVPQGLEGPQGQDHSTHLTQSLNLSASPGGPPERPDGPQVLEGLEGSLGLEGPQGGSSVPLMQSAEVPLAHSSYLAQSPSLPASPDIPQGLEGLEVPGGLEGPQGGSRVPLVQSAEVPHHVRLQWRPYADVQGRAALVQFAVKVVQAVMQERVAVGANVLVFLESASAIRSVVDGLQVLVSASVCVLKLMHLSVFISSSNLKRQTSNIHFKAGTEYLIHKETAPGTAWMTFGHRSQIRSAFSYTFSIFRYFSISDTFCIQDPIQHPIRVKSQPAPS